MYLSLKFTAGNKLAYTGLCARQARFSWSTGPFGPHEGLHESPRPCLLLSGRGARGKRATAVLCISFKIPPLLLNWHTLRKEEVRTYVSPEVRAHLGSTIACMTALAHAHVPLPLIVLFPYGLRAARLEYTTGGASKLMYTARKKST